MTSMGSYPSKANRHQHPLHFVYVGPEVNFKYGWRRWLKVAVCDECDHKEWSDVTYEEPPKDLIWRLTENGKVEPQAKKKDSDEPKKPGRPEVQHSHFRNSGVGQAQEGDSDESQTEEGERS